MSTQTLSTPPNLGALYRKAVLTGFGRHGRELPDVELELRDVSVDVERLADYDRVCGFTLRDELPATYVNVLAFPLQVKLMTDPSFPFPLPGLVHIRNTITQFRPVRAEEALSFRVRAADLRPHERGKQFDVVSEVFVGDELVLRAIGTMLRRGGGSGERSRSAAAEPPPASAVWRVPVDIGRRYAAVSGDINPIHMNNLAAKAFGFPRSIAHGMWTKAHCLAAFEGRLPASFTVDAQFKTPILLPSKVAFWASREGEGWSFGVHDAKKGKPHLSGSVQPA
ncbi:hypothetical protein GCM10012275_31560 [Longimycelium tulufanense]|uniref:MaoC-like domain-containing protein n=1 Tax=Longimycelium tulufanense TaxID=907463 RepID=A0A8J3CF47_9PSEU|nr:MaoC/PaaZ C-terminal domain-containing protein [Longimycelium tulufanense]GGM58039.1 hypothetical protein GCM10012275_31560 [Longimycelium tulufanense]